MSDSIINIILNTVKKGGGDKEALTGLKQLSKSFKEFTGINLGAVTAVGAVSMALNTFKKIANESIQATVKLGTETEDMQMIMGDSAESVSRFIQVVDDARVPFETLERAMDAAAKKGIDVSVSSLAKMSDEFQNLKTEQEQNIYLSEKFGKSGLEMEKVLKIGSAALYQRMGAVSENIVMDEAGVKATVEYQEAMDVFNDSIDGVKNKIGKELTPIIGDYALVLGNLVEKLSSANTSQGKWFAAIAPFLGIIGGVATEVKNLNQFMNNRAEKLREEKILQEKTALAMQIYKSNVRETWEYLETGLNPALDSSGRQMGSLAMQAEYAANQAEDSLAPALEETKNNLIDINNVDISFGDKIAGEIEKLNWLQAGGGEIQRLGESIKSALAEGKITPEMAEEAYKGLFVQNEALALKQGEDKDKLIANIIETFGVTQTEASKMLDEVYTDYDNKLLRWTAIIDVIERGGYIPEASGKNEAGDFWQAGGGFASGADFVVPPGYPNDSYGPIYVESGEHVQVTPAGQASGNGIVINVNGAGDPKQVANEVMRELRRQGVGR